MKKTWQLLLTISFALLLSAGAIAKDRGAGKHYVFNVIGEATAYPSTVPDPDGEPGDVMDANCFDVDLIDLKNKRLIGAATDCLSVQEVIGDFEFIRLIGTTTFNLRQGSLTTHTFHAQWGGSYSYHGCGWHWQCHYRWHEKV